MLKSLILKVVPLSLRLLSKDWKKKNSSEIGQGLRGNFNRERKGRRKEEQINQMLLNSTGKYKEQHVQCQGTENPMFRSTV